MAFQTGMNSYLNHNYEFIPSEYEFVLTEYDFIPIKKGSYSLSVCITNDIRAKSREQRVESNRIRMYFFIIIES